MSYYFVRFEILCLDEACVCTAEYNVKYKGKLTGDYCYNWVPHLPPYCYLRGGMSASSCPGAKRSSQGEFYFTEDDTICKASISKLYKAHLKLCIPFNIAVSSLLLTIWQISNFKENRKSKKSLHDLTFLQIVYLYAKISFFTNLLIMQQLSHRGSFVKSAISTAVEQWWWWWDVVLQV